MPSKTPKQSRFMRACATTGKSKRLKLKCPPKKVAAEFVKKDSMMQKTRRTMRKR